MLFTSSSSFSSTFHRSKKNPGDSEPTGASRRSGRLSSQAFRTGYPERLISSARHARIQSNSRRPAPPAADVRGGAHRTRASRPGSRLVSRRRQKARVVFQSTSWDAKYSGANSDVNIFSNIFALTKFCGVHACTIIMTGTEFDRRVLYLNQHDTTL